MKNGFGNKLQTPRSITIVAMEVLPQSYSRKTSETIAKLDRLVELALNIRIQKPRESCKPLYTWLNLL